MIRQCAWCLKILGQVAPLEDKSVTHGICRGCTKKMREDVEKIRKVGVK